MATIDRLIQVDCLRDNAMESVPLLPPLTKNTPLWCGFPSAPTPGTRDGHDRRDRETNQENEYPDKSAHNEQEGSMAERIQTPVDALSECGQRRKERVIPAGIGMANLILVDDRLGLILPFIDKHVIHPIVAATLKCPPAGGEKLIGHLRLILDLLKGSIYIAAGLDPWVRELLNPAHADLALPLRRQDDGRVKGDTYLKGRVEKASEYEKSDGDGDQDVGGWQFPGPGR
jgi:hypothetical protein